MKKIILVSTAVVFSSMLFVQAGSAQLINWERRNKQKQENAASASTQAGVQRAQQQVQKQVMKQLDPQVVSRVERIYDVNGDGKLQANELKDFSRT